MPLLDRRSWLALSLLVLAGGARAGAQELRPQVWRGWEHALTSRRNYDNPHADVTLRVSYVKLGGRVHARRAGWVPRNLGHARREDPVCRTEGCGRRRVPPAQPLGRGRPGVVPHGKVAGELAGGLLRFPAAKDEVVALVPRGTILEALQRNIDKP